MDWLILYVVIAIDTYLFLAASPRCILIFRWYEGWVGYFHDRNHQVLYLFFIPFLGLRYDLRSREIKVDSSRQ